jgi:phage shock protein PspC (stress-responsive transcriptional regulator)
MKKYHRVHDESKIFGVCSGIGNYTNTDPLIWRLVFFFSIFTPFPIITGYLLTTILTKKV